MYSPTQNTTSTLNSNSPSFSSSDTPKAEQTNSHFASKPRTQKFKQPLIYEAITQARVRSGYELTSRYATDLPEGSVLKVAEIRNNRARIIAPIYGWISIVSKYGIQIIMPLNKHTAKIGGSVIFTKKRMNSIKTYYETMYGKIIEYNQGYGMHKIQCKDGTQQWMSLQDPNVHYIPKSQIAKEMVNSTSVNLVQQSQEFFNQFFVKDYPQFGNKDKDTKSEKYNEMKTKTHIVTVNNNFEKHKPKSKLSEEFEVEKKRNDFDNKLMSNKSNKYICRKSEKEFINKIREIEKKIINHLHLRGYYENHPDFWRYIAKAKELAITKAERERHKLLQRQKLEQQTRNN